MATAAAAATCFLVFLCFLTHISEAKVRHYKWEVKYEYKSPDCFKKLVITINGKTPGPTIIARQNDTVVVDLKNGLGTENVAIHWHGIRQIGSPWADGTEGVTQCPILPGDTFRYKFVVDRPGTYLYHAHYGMQREAGLYGLIRSTYEQAAGLSSIPFRWVGEPQSLLIHGKGRYDCSTPSPATLGECNQTNPECSSPYTMTVVPGKTYRLRIGSLTALAALSFQIQGHNMTVVEADGHYVDPFVIQTLYIYSGETYSVLVKTDQDPSRNYRIASNVVSRNRTTPPGLGVFNYYPNHPRRLPTGLPIAPLWNDTGSRLAQSLAIRARPGHIHDPPRKSDRVIVLLNTQNEVGGIRRWSVNNVSFNLPHTPYLIGLKHNLLHTFSQTPPPEGYDYKSYDIRMRNPNANATISDGIYRLEFGSTVDVILQNANTMVVNNSETHPWHLHGHDFWVMGYGEGKFDPEKDPERYNLVDPIMKNTVPVHPYGWTALRFKADNPGVWLFHCHIESHFHMGMGVVFEEGIDKVADLPSSIGGCGETRGLVGGKS
ncbi:L-ascorbate oxidase [Linum grandiflorum]